MRLVPCDSRQIIWSYSKVVGTLAALIYCSVNYREQLPGGVDRHKYAVWLVADTRWILAMMMLMMVINIIDI